MWCNFVPTNILLNVRSMPFHHLFQDLCCQSIVTTIYHLRYFPTLWHKKCELDSVYFVLELTGLLAGVFFQFFLLLIPKMFNAFPWLSKTHTSISGLSRTGKWNYKIPWNTRFSMFPWPVRTLSVRWGEGGRKIFCGTPQHTFWHRWWCRCLSGRGGHWLSTKLRGFPFKFFRSLTQIFRFFSFFFLLCFLFFAGRFIADFLPWFCLD